MSKGNPVPEVPKGPHKINTSIDRADNGGFIVRHHHEGPGPYRPPKQHVFTTGHEMLRHIGKVHKIGRKAERGGSRK